MSTICNNLKAMSTCDALLKNVGCPYLYPGQIVVKRQGSGGSARLSKVLGHGSHSTLPPVTHHIAFITSTAFIIWTLESVKQYAIVDWQFDQFVEGVGTVRIANWVRRELGLYAAGEAGVFDYLDESGG